MPRAGPRVLLLGSDAGHNIGDRAISAALARCFTAHDPETLITTVGDAARHHQTPGIAQIIPHGAHGLPALLAAAHRADRIVISGGRLFQDDYSRARTPYWASRIAMLHAHNSQIAGLALDAGPLRHPESRLAARIACAAMMRISARDRPARAALQACTRRRIELAPDPAFMLEPASRQEALAFVERSGLPAGRPLIVVTLRRWYHARGGFMPDGLKARLGIDVKRDLARFENMLGVAARTLQVLARRFDAEVLLLPCCNVGHDADDAACEALMWRMPTATVRLARIADPRLYKAVLGLASLVVSARLHPLVMAAGMGVPFVGLSYHPKFDGLYDLLGLSTRSLPLNQCPEVWDEATLVTAAEAALDAHVNLRQRAEVLAAAARREALNAAFGRLREGTVENLRGDVHL